MKSSGVVALTLLLTAGSDSLQAAPKVDRNESRRFVGREDDVRVDAQLVARNLRPNAPVAIIVEIENDRSQPIAFDPQFTTADYDEQTGTITINVGAEIPDPKKPMRLQVIRAGERKSFQAAARLSVPTATLTSFAPRPRLVQVKVNYLGNVEPFLALIESSKPANPDPGLFPTWVDNNVAVVTNAVPFEFAKGGGGGEMLDASRRGYGRGAF